VEFSDVFWSSVVDRDVENRFFNLIIASLYFSNLPERYEFIPKAHQDTFHWLFANDAQQQQQQQMDTVTGTRSLYGHLQQTTTTSFGSLVNQDLERVP
jgi:hypothetical protein